MPAALNLVAVLPNALQYRWLYDGVGDASAVRTQAELLTDLEAAKPGGQLNSLLKDATTDDAWAALPVTVFTSPNTLGRSRLPIDGKLTVRDESRVLQVQAKVGAVGMATVEVRLPTKT